MAAINLSPVLISTVNIANKVAIITGGASGVGAQIVKRLSACGAHPWFCDVDTLAGEALVASTPNSHFIYADVTDWEAMYEFLRDVHRATGHIDLVFANAGYMHPSFLTSPSTLSFLFSGPIYMDTTSPITGILLPPPFSSFDRTLTSAIYAAKLALYFFRRNATTTRPGGSVIFTTTASGPNINSSPSLHPTLKLQSGVIELMRSLRALWPDQHGLSYFHVGSVAVPSDRVPQSPIPTSTAQVPQQLLNPHGIINEQLAIYIALALVIMASNPNAGGKNWIVLDGGRCIEDSD